MPPIESLSRHLRVEILAWLDRMSVERSTAVSRRFRSAADALILTRQVPLRILPHITFSSDAFFDYVAARAFRWTKVEKTRVFGDDVITPTPITASEWSDFIEAFSTATVEQLHFSRLSFCPVTPDDCAKVLRLDGLRELEFSQCSMLSAHFDNAFLSNFPVEGETSLYLDESIPCDRSEFAMNDEGILAYLFASGSNGTRWLELYNVGATEELPRKIIEMKTKTDGTGVDFRFRMFTSQEKCDEYRRILDTMGLRRLANAKGDRFIYLSDDRKIKFLISKDSSHLCMCAHLYAE
ncbi:hypothetical protein AAVH_31456 [Aphelenchoides avenae]|nr:hypothetical protein AAVH_31456 [Aphelenchus avenae]